jgi:NhaP-type Na+/H+ or K+/H+ antiporter
LAYLAVKILVFNTTIFRGDYPTLGQTIVSSKDVPETLRQTINVESVLNDGLALPFVLFGQSSHQREWTVRILTG